MLPSFFTYDELTRCFVYCYILSIFSFYIFNVRTDNVSVCVCMNEN